MEKGRGVCNSLDPSLRRVIRQIRLAIRAWNSLYSKALCRVRQRVNAQYQRSMVRTTRPCWSTA